MQIQHVAHTLPTPSSFFITARNSIKSVRFTTSVCPSVCGWHVVENNSLVQSFAQSVFQKYTTWNYLICDAFSATFSENITNVHCSPEHCDDLLNSSRFYDVFLFFVTDVHWSPKHCDDLLNSSQFYDVFLFFVTDVHWWILKPRTLRRFVKFVTIRPTTLRRLSRFVMIKKWKKIML
jgi:hypothetical protein